MNKDFSSLIQADTTHPQDKPEHLFDQFCKFLDPDQVYFFLLRNQRENKLVCTPPGEDEHIIYEVNLTGEHHTPLLLVPELQFESVKDVMDYTKQIDPKKLQGVIAFNSDNSPIKIVNSLYQELFQLRGNEPNLKFRYLQLRTSHVQSHKFLQLYPEMIMTAELVENGLKKAGLYIFHSYKQRYINKSFIKVPQEEFFVMKKCHEWHCSNREENKINLAKVLVLLDEEPASNLNRLLTRFM